MSEPKATESELQSRECDVHRIVYGDRRPKQVGYCDFCKAWICEDCRGRWTLRTLAALLHGLGVSKAEKAEKAERVSA